MAADDNEDQSANFLRTMATASWKQTAGCLEQAALWEQAGDQEMAAFWKRNAGMHTIKAKACEAGFLALKTQADVVKLRQALEVAHAQLAEAKNTLKPEGEA